MDEDTIEEIVRSINGVKHGICENIALLINEERCADNKSNKYNNIIYAFKALKKDNSNQDSLDPNVLLDFLHDKQNREEGSDMYLILEEEEYYNFLVIIL